MNFLPFDDKVLIRPAEAKEVSLGGVYLPDADKAEKIRQGIVLAVGPGVYKDGARVPMQTKRSHTVYFPKHLAVTIRLDNEDLVLVRESDILGRYHKVLVTTLPPPTQNEVAEAKEKAQSNMDNALRMFDLGAITAEALDNVE